MGEVKYPAFVSLKGMKGGGQEFCYNWDFLRVEEKHCSCEKNDPTKSRGCEKTGNKKIHPPPPLIYPHAVYMAENTKMWFKNSKLGFMWTVNQI